MSEGTVSPRKVTKCWRYELLVPMEGGRNGWIRSMPMSYSGALAELEWWERRGFKGQLLEVAP